MRATRCSGTCASPPGVVCDWPFLVRCPGSPLAVPGLAEYGTTLVLVELVWLNGVAAAALILLAQRLRLSDPVTRRAITPLLVAALLMVPVFAASVVDVAPPGGTLLAAAYYLAVGLLPVAVVAGLVWAWMRRVQVGPLVLALDQGVGPDGCVTRWPAAWGIRAW